MVKKLNKEITINWSIIKKENKCKLIKTKNNRRKVNKNNNHNNNNKLL